MSQVESSNLASGGRHHRRRYPTLLDEHFQHHGQGPDAPLAPAAGVAVATADEAAGAMTGRQRKKEEEGEAWARSRR